LIGSAGLNELLLLLQQGEHLTVILELLAEGSD